jgi:hypothetical protein
MIPGRYQQTNLDQLSFVMAGLVPAIHVLIFNARKTWMPGIKPGMTAIAKEKPRPRGRGVNSSAQA